MLAEGKIPQSYDENDAAEDNEKMKKENEMK